MHFYLLWSYDEPILIDILNILLYIFLFLFILFYIYILYYVYLLSLSDHNGI